ncbi:MAG: hypothetical protein ACREMH_06800, partial [Gemmatimonadales bacterium]
MTESLLAGSPRAARLGVPGPATLPLLPVLYLAWADGDLEADEVSRLRERICSTQWLGPADREWLRGWLDPADPPTPEDLAALRRTVRVRAMAVPDGGRASLSALGLELQLRAAEGGEGPWTSPEARTALNELWSDLGLDLPSALAELDLPLPPSPAPSPPEPRWPIDTATLRAFLD